MITIELTQGKVALIDDKDATRITPFKWFAIRVRKNGRWYAGRKLPRRGKKQQDLLYMHREILNAPAGMVVDHINGDGLDNRRQNLRITTGVENSRNRPKNTRNKSGFKGVTIVKDKFVARIRHFGKDIHIGTFGSDIEAARAYDTKSKELHGIHARLNFPETEVAECQ